MILVSTLYSTANAFGIPSEYAIEDNYIHFLCSLSISDCLRCKSKMDNINEIIDFNVLMVNFNF